MNFPYRSLLLLLQFARGKQELNDEVVSAALDVLRYAWAQVRETLLPKGETPSDATPAQLIECLLADHLDDQRHKVELQDADLKPSMTSSQQAEIEAELQDAQPMAFTPSIWITLGLWLLETVVKRWMDKK